MKGFSYLVATLVVPAFLASTVCADILSVTNNNSNDPTDVYELSLADLADGELVNIDRTHVFANLPSLMQGIDYVLTANDDKTATAANAFSVDVTFDAGTTLFLSIDGRVGDEDGSNAPTLGSGIMDWVIADGWTDTALSWNKANENADNTKFFVYSLTPAGTSYQFLEQDNFGNRNMYSIAGGDGPFFFGPTLTVNRDTGSLTLSTDIDTDILGYSITSASGTLDQTNWTPIAGHYDASTGADGSVDSDDIWKVLTAEGGFTDLSEAQLGGTGPFDGGVVQVGEPIDLSAGDAWIPFPTEDLQMTLLRVDGTQDVVPVVFVGNGDEPFAVGDLNFNGAIDAIDHGIFAAGLHTDLSDMTIAQAYTQGDMNGDLANNFDDVVLFRTIYDGIHGAGAFAALTASVPEPTTLALLLFAGMFLVRQRRSLGRHVPDSFKILLIVSCFMGLSTNQAEAQLLTVTNNNSIDPTDVYELSLADLADGELVNIDRNHVFANLPPVFHGLDYVLTANDDKVATAANSFSVDVTFDVGTTLLLSIDGRVGDEDGSNAPTLGNGIMDWVLADGWADTGLTWNKANENANTLKFFVYRLDPAGTSYRFFEQDNFGNRNMYSVAGGVVGDLEPTLLVNTTTGQLKIVNGMNSAIELNYYEITSEAGSLDPTEGTGWNSLDDQGIGFGTQAGQSWTEAGGSDANILSEFFTLGATSVDSEGFLGLGSGFDGPAEDLQFRYGVAGSDRLFVGKVEYETGGSLSGDYNNNGQVEQGDLDLVLLNWGGTTLPPDWTNGDHPPTFPIDANDLVAVRQNWGSSLGSATAAAVPEPTSAILLLAGMLATGLARRRE